MSILVQKYGGSSVASEDKLRRVAAHVAEAKRAGHDVVVVVSAMGGTTSELLGMANNITKTPRARELDMLLSSGERISMSLLSMAVQDLGLDSISLTGPQCGIKTCNSHYNARIDRVEPERILAELKRGRVVVAAGYQGVSPENEITTLGRGGSDTTAVALAAALSAERCEIYSDVDGVYSADPRIVKNAQRIDAISYQEMVTLAKHGASVLNTRAVEYAWHHDVPLRARSTFEPDSPGTAIGEMEESTQARISGVACHKVLLPVVISGGEPTQAVGDEVLDMLGRADVFVDRTRKRDGHRELLISADVIADTDAFAERLKERFGTSLQVGDKRGSVSAVGLRLGETPKVHKQILAAAAAGNLRVHAQYPFEHAFTCVVEPVQVSRAMNVLHDALITTNVKEQEVA